MEQKIIKHLNIYYYGVMLLALLIGVGLYYLQSKNLYQPIDPMSTAGQLIQYAVIIYALVTIPLGLYLFKRQCKTISAMPDGLEKLLRYQKGARMRILLVSGSMVLGIAAFYLMGGYQSMIWIAAISAIGWYFTKPTLRKMELELQPQDPNQENY